MIGILGRKSGPTAPPVVLGVMLLALLLSLPSLAGAITSVATNHTQGGDTDAPATLEEGSGRDGTPTDGDPDDPLDIGRPEQSAFIVRVIELSVLFGI